VKSMHPGMEGKEPREPRDKERVKSMHPGMEGKEPREPRDKERVKSMHPGMNKPTKENSGSENNSPMKSKPELKVDPNHLAVNNSNSGQIKSPISKTTLSNRVTMLDGVPKRKSSVIPPLNRQMMNRQNGSPSGVNSPLANSNTPNTPSGHGTPTYGGHLTVGNAVNTPESGDKHNNNVNEQITPTTPQLNEVKKMHSHHKQPTKSGSIDSVTGIQMRRVTQTNITSPMLRSGAPNNANQATKNGSASSNSSTNNGANKNANNDNMSPVSISSKNSMDSPITPPMVINKPSRKIPSALPQNLPPGVSIFTAMEKELNLPPPVDEIKIDEGKFKRIYPNGTTLISFKNGTVKEINAEGTSIIRFPNGDIKQVLSNKEVIYFYHETKAIQTTHTNGIEVFEFPNGQVETKYPDSSIEIVFPDKTIRRIFANGEEENVYANGIKMRTTADGQKLVDYPDGSKEIYTDNFRKLVKSDGTVRIIYADGRRETQFPNGHVIVKDAKGNIIGESNNN